MNSYRFGGGETRRPISGPLPEGDYGFEVTDYQPVYQKDNGNWVLRITLQIEDHKIFDQCWSGRDKNGEKRDGIGELLLCVNRAPPKKDQEPDWRKLIGAHGKCRLKVEVAQMGALAGKERNRVAWYYRPKEVGPGTEVKQEETNEQWAERQRRSKQEAGAPDDIEPEDIPFRTRIYRDVRQSRLNRRVF